MTFYILYETKCLINAKIYVGKHVTRNLDDGYLGSGTLLWHAINKHGRDNFSSKIICFCESHEELLVLERRIVNEEFVSRKDTYNIALGGIGPIHTKEMLKKMSDAKKGKTWEEIFGQEEANRRRIAQSKRTSEMNKGREYTDEMRRRLAEQARKTHTGRKRSLETRRKISESQKGKVIPPETRKLISERTKEAMKDVVTPEYRKKLSDAQKKRHALNGPKLTKEQMVECLRCTKTLVAAMAYAKNTFGVSISYPTFRTYRMRYTLLDTQQGERNEV